MGSRTVLIRVPKRGVGMVNARFQSGSTLIEVAVSLLIVSIGVLGLAGLQLSSKRAGFEALQRTTAVALAQDILERMRANPGSLAGYDDQTLGNNSISTEPAACTASCAPAQIAARDLWEWEQAVDGGAETRVVSGSTVPVGGLVNPVGCIDTNVNGEAGMIQISIAWEGYESLSTHNVDNSCGDALGASRQLLTVTTFISDQV